jgi:hypothetical protein
MFCDGLRSCIGWRLGAFSPIVLRQSEARADKWTAIFEFKVVLAMLVWLLGFHDAAAGVQQKISRTLSLVVDGRGVVAVVCYARVRVPLASSLGNESVVVPLPLPAHGVVTAV